MREIEKMLNGGLYNPADEELVGLRKQARLLFEQYNKTSISESQKRKELLNKLIGKAGNNLYIEPDFKCDYGINIEFGDNVYLNFNCIFLDVCKIKVGDNVLFATGVQVLTATHPTDVTLRNKGLEYAKPINIGNSCWIGANALILPGVTIGANSTIGAGSIVNKDIPANSLAVGSPCRVIKDLS